METSKAPTRHFCRQTCVRRSLTRGCSGRCPLPVCQSVFLFFFSSARYVPICANMVQGRADTCGIGLIRADLGRISPYRPQPPIPAPNGPIQAEIQKKKSCKTHRLGKNNKTLSLSQFSLLTDSFSHSHLQLSLTLSLVSVLHGSLPLASALRQSVSPLSHNLTLTLTHHNLILNSLTTSLTR